MRQMELKRNGFPRVLAVSDQPFWQGCGTGLTLMNLFREWPKDRLACLYTFGKIQPDTTFCPWQHALSSADLRFLGRLPGNSPPRARPALETASKQAADGRSDWRHDSSFASHLRSIKSHIPRQKLRDFDTYRLPPDLVERLNEFKPQVVYATLASNPLLRLCLDLADRYSIPIVPHFMDDWPTTHYSSSLFQFFLRKAMQQRLAAVFERAPRRMVVGHAMADEYARRYGGEFVPFMNCVEPQLLKSPATAPASGKKIRLIYLGGLHLNRGRSLREIAMALKQLHREGLEAEALIHTPPRFAGEAKRLNVPPVMRAAGTLAASDVPAALRNAHIIIHAESFDRSTRTFAKYSISTKIPESMASARPIFAYGPEELASIRYIRESGSGLAVTRRDPGELAATLRQLIASEPLRERLGKQGHQTANLRHNAAVERQRFREILAAAANESRPEHPAETTT